MRFTHKTTKDTLTLSLTGELDHHGAAATRKAMDAVILEQQPKKVVLELKDVQFCDSSGLGLLMGRYKTALTVGAVLTVKEPSPPVSRIMKLAGLDKLIKTERSVEV